MGTLLCRKMGLQSLPVAFGVDTAKWITVGTIDVTQIAVALYLAFGRHTPIYAGVLTALILPQVGLLVWHVGSVQAAIAYCQKALGIWAASQHICNIQ